MKLFSIASVCAVALAVSDATGAVVPNSAECDVCINTVTLAILSASTSGEDLTCEKVEDIIEIVADCNDCNTDSERAAVLVLLKTAVATIESTPSLSNCNTTSRDAVIESYQPPAGEPTQAPTPTSSASDVFPALGAITAALMFVVGYVAN